MNKWGLPCPKLLNRTGYVRYSRSLSLVFFRCQGLKKAKGRARQLGVNWFPQQEEADFRENQCVLVPSPHTLGWSPPSLRTKVSDFAHWGVHTQ